MRLVIAQSWDGRPVEPLGSVELDVCHALDIAVEAIWFGDPAPPRPAGHCPGLWEHEVVEVFVAGAEGRYTEIELSPHGHHLVLTFANYRQRDGEIAELGCAVERDGSRWRGRARLPLAHLPKPPWRVNAFSIHGPPEARVYSAHRGEPGPKPDFHRIDSYVAWPR